MPTNVQSPSPAADIPFLRDLLGSLDSEVAAKVIAASGDVAMIIDRDGVICDLALHNDDMARDGAGSWLDRVWADTVTSDSKPKVEALLRDAFSDRPPHWRELNQLSPYGDPFAVRYLAVDSGHDGRVIAIGRDNRATAAMQQRLMHAQQAMERDYARLRDAESRYRLLFQMSGEAILIVDAVTRKVIEANPAAEEALGSAKVSLIGQSFPALFESQSRDTATALLAMAQATPRSEGANASLVANDRTFDVSGSLFRQDRQSMFLARLSSPDSRNATASDTDARLLSILEKIPDAFVVTDMAMRILATNAAFLDLAQIGGPEQAVGLQLDQFVGRPALDRNVLLESLRTHGSVRNFSTVLHNRFGDPEDVEISAVAVLEGAEPCFGFTIRSVGRRLHERAPGAQGLRRSVEELTELVGRVTLKELVRDTTDLVERLCIEAALELTGDNRASAADVLGLSRQGLYSKLHRFGLGNLPAGEN